MPSSAATPTSLSIKKYANRRFYDSTRSCHVTLEQMYELIRAGYEIAVTDSTTGRDITPNVLGQILLEMDSFKLAWLPSPLLHHIIRSNESIVREFVEVYFNQAFEWFLRSRELMEQQMRQLMGLAGSASAQDGAAPPPPPDVPAFAQPTSANPDRASELNRRIEDLSERIAGIQRQLAEGEPN